MSYLHISRIHIIQSLTLSEIQTGDKIREDIDGYITYAEHPVNCVLENVYNKEDLFLCLDRIAEETKESNFPIVHFECHGSQTGLELANGQVIPWLDINARLTKINMISRLNLIVVFSLCYGAHFIKSMDNLHRSPCLMFFGPTEKISTNEIVSSLSEFYRYLIYECDGTKSFKFLVSKKLEFGRFSMTTCIHFFKRIIELYYQQTRGYEAERARRIRKIIKKQKHSRNVSVGSIKRSLAGYENEYLRKLYDTYFFADLYPENRNRFSQLVGIKNTTRRNSFQR